jgi:hypothetical protein
MRILDEPLDYDLSQKRACLECGSRVETTIRDLFALTPEGPEDPEMPRYGQLDLVYICPVCGTLEVVRYAGGYRLRLPENIDAYRIPHVERAVADRVQQHIRGGGEYIHPAQFEKKYWVYRPSSSSPGFTLDQMTADEIKATAQWHSEGQTASRRFVIFDGPATETCARDFDPSMLR